VILLLYVNIFYIKNADCAQILVSAIS
jgi:hypothetical protein